MPVRSRPLHGTIAHDDDVRAPRVEQPVFLRACRGEPVPHTPVWFMRQAGRSLPEYREVRAGIPMLEACRRPDLVCEITLQPVRRHGVDAAILFSDIVVPLAAAGVDLDIVPGTGPVVAEPVPHRWPTWTGYARSTPDDVEYVAEAVRLLVAELGRTPLIGFAGAPFTLASYLVEGGPSRTHARTKALMYGEPDALARAVRAGSPRSPWSSCGCRSTPGVAAVQLFDSWAGALSGGRLPRFVLPHSTGGARPGWPHRCAADPLRGRHRRTCWRDGRGRRRRGRAWTGAPRWTWRPGRSARPGGAGQPRPGRALRAVAGRRGRGAADPGGGRGGARARVQPRPRRAARDRPGRADPGGGAGTRACHGDRQIVGARRWHRRPGGRPAAARTCEPGRRRHRARAVADRPGGKLRTGQLAGGAGVELGAETFLVRDPATGAECGGAAGPAGGARRRRWSTRRPVPRRAGRRRRAAPAAARHAAWACPPTRRRWTSVAPSWPAARRPDEGRPLLAPGEDVAVGELVRQRLGDEVVDRLVDPLLGGVYAGRADDLSLRPPSPGWPPPAAGEHTLTARGPRRVAAAPRPPGCAGLRDASRGGAEPAACAAVADGRAAPRCGCGTAGPAAAGPDRRPGWRLTLGLGPATRRSWSTRTRWCWRCRPGRRPACSPASTRRRPSGRARSTTPAWRWSRWRCRPAPSCPSCPGFLVPAGRGVRGQGGHVLHHASGRTCAAPTARSWCAPRSAGTARAGAAARRREPGRRWSATSWPGCSARAAGAGGDAVVQRWGGALPQYAPGHLAAGGAAAPRPRCRPTLAWPAPPTTGSASPACVRSGEAAARRRSAAALEESASMSRTQTNAARLRELNATIRYTMWSVFRAATPLARRCATTWPARSRRSSTSWPPRTSWCAAPTTCPGCAPTPTS